jgi:trimethylamine:corrinoid methyltransferase-like protein
VWEACAEVLTIENAANGIWEEPISGVQADNDTQPLDGVSATAGEVCTRFVAEEVLEEDAAKPFYGAPLVDRESTLTPATVVLKDNAMQPADTVTNMLAEVSLNEVDLAEPN